MTESEVFKRGTADPVWFVKNVIGYDLWSKQRDILHSVRDNKFTAVRSCNGAGKSFVSASAVAWALGCHYESIVLTTAPTTRQVEEILWQEIARLHAQSKFPLGGELLKTKWTMGPKWFALGLSTNDPSRFQGFHAPFILIIMDEACHDDQTEVLTEAGWKLFADLTLEDRVLSMSPETLEAEYTDIDRIIDKPYTGPMYRYASPNRPSSICVTPDHMMFGKDCHGQKGYKKLPATQAFAQGDFVVPKSISWKVPDVPQFELDGRVFDMDEWLRFLGWYCSEGSIGYTASGKAYSVNISQSMLNTQNRTEILNTCIALGYTPCVYRDIIRINNTQLARYLAPLGKAVVKTVPDFVRFVSARQIDIFLDAFVSGDGYHKTADRDIMYTSSVQMANALQELVLKTGRDSTVRIRHIAGQVKQIQGHTATSSVDGYVVSRGRTQAHLKIRQRNIVQEDYDGRVYCVTTRPNHLIYTRRDGSCVWSGNCGVGPEIYEAVSAVTVSDGAHVLLIGNPTDPNTEFFKAFNSPLYNKIHISAYDTPGFTNELGSGISIPGLITREWAEQRKQEWGENSPAFMARVLGEFPDTSTSAMIPLSWIMRAVETAYDSKKIPRTMGVDVARFGDDLSVIVCRVGNTVTAIHPFHKLDTVEVADEVERLFNDTGGYEIIAVDAVGVGGGVADILRRRGYPAVDVESGQTAYMTTRFNNRRTEMWFRLRELLRTADISLPNNDLLIGELSAPKYTFDLAGRYRLETKDEMKRRGLASPNIADAVVYAFAYDGKYKAKTLLEQSNERYKKNTYQALLDELVHEHQRKETLW